MNSWYIVFDSARAYFCVAYKGPDQAKGMFNKSSKFAFLRPGEGKFISKKCLIKLLGMRRRKDTKC